MTDQLNEFRSGFVAVVGRPNVGKSTLLNALLGQKVAIASPRPQTTRRKQLGILTTREAQLIFVDTPGIHRPRHALDKYMVGVATDALSDADVILWVIDIASVPTPEDERLGQLIAEHAPQTPMMMVFNKSDALKPEHVLGNTDMFRGLAPEAQWMLVSATRGDNLDKIVPMLIDHLPPGPQYYSEDEVTDLNLRDLAAELIREAALHALREEVPHGIAVEIEEFIEDEGQMPHISAMIYVERDGHKGIVIGKGGETLKRIGQRARQEIEAQLQTQVFLELRVKVLPAWRQSDRDIKRLGYE